MHALQPAVLGLTKIDIMQCTVCLLLLFDVKTEWNSRDYILFEIYGIPTENTILTTCQSNAKEMFVNLDAEKNSR